MRVFLAGALLLCMSCSAWGDDEDCVDVTKLLGPEDAAVGDAKKPDRGAVRALGGAARRVADMRDRAAELRDTQERTIGTAERIRNLHKANEDDLQEVARSYRRALDDLPGNSCKLWEARQALGLALGYTRNTAVAASQYDKQYGLYIGPNYSLGGKGDWQPGAEMLVRFDTEAFTEQDPDYNWMNWAVSESGWLRGYTELSYQSINALEETEDAAAGAVPADSVFASASGYARLNVGLQTHVTNWWGMQLGGGLSSLPNNDGITTLEPRAFGGLHFQTLFNDGAVGQIFVGAAYDEFWQREVLNTAGDPLSGTHVEESFGRYNLDGLLFVPGQLGNFHVATRLFADAPIDGKGPSDLRISILVYYDINKWLDTFVPIRDVRSVTDTLTKSQTY